MASSSDATPTPDPHPAASTSPSPSPPSPAPSARPGVAEFLSSQVFFITGITGFLGKVLLAKLLTSCGARLGTRSLYVLVRGKKEQTARERFEAEVLSSSPIFAPIIARLGMARLREIICVVDGDISKSKLGLSAAALAEVSARVTVILHLAATVNFNERLRFAVDINVLGVRPALLAAIPPLHSRARLGEAYHRPRAPVPASACGGAHEHVLR